jgi:hypothetical protein
MMAISHGDRGHKGGHILFQHVDGGMAMQNGAISLRCMLTLYLIVFFRLHIIVTVGFTVSHLTPKQIQTNSQSIECV